MTQQINTALLVARILMSLLFIMAGIGKLGNVEGFAILAGFMTRPTALALAAFCFASGLLYHFDPSDQNQMNNLLKNLALAGGYIALAIAGAGKFSVDGRKG